MKFVILDRLELLIGDIKEKFVAKKSGWDLSQNDLTDALKAQYDAAQANVLEGVKVNGAEQTITDKTVDIAVPTAVSQLTNDSDFQTAAQVSTTVASAIGSAGHLKREIVASLPDAGAADADTVYLVSKSGDGTADNVYTEYMVISGGWEIIGDTRVDLTGYLKISDIEPITDEEIHALFA